MNNSIQKVINIVGGLAIILLFILVLVGGNHQSVKLGAGPTTNLPSFGLANLWVGPGCDQQYTTCAAYSAGSTSPDTIISSNGIYAIGGLTEGGYDATTSPTSLMLLQASDLLNSSLISITAQGGATTVTLPATSTLASFVPNVGDTTTITFSNPNATSTITVASGAGTNLLAASSTATIQGTKLSNLKFIRLPTSNIAVTMGTAN